MKQFFIILICIFIALIGVSCAFQVFEMASTSMEPTIMGQGNPPSHHGDYVLVSKWFLGNLKRGDLVIVGVDTNQIAETIRRVYLVPGDELINSDSKEQKQFVPEGYYYLLGDSTNAIDSNQLGLFSHKKIHGRVLWIIHSK